MIDQAAHCLAGAVLRRCCPELASSVVKTLGEGGGGVGAKTVWKGKKLLFFLVAEMVTGSCSQIPSWPQRGLLGLQQLWYMEPRDAGSGEALEATREAELSDVAPRSHLSPLLYSRGVCPAWWGAGGLHLPAGAGEGLLWLTHREEPALFHPPRAHESPGILLKCRGRISRFGLGLRVCISNTLPRNASTASQQSTL